MSNMGQRLSSWFQSLSPVFCVLSQEAMISARTFGVEIECGHDTHHWESTERLFKREGFPLGRNKGWSFGHDGSGIEVRTPILKGEKGYREVIRAMDLLADNDFWVSRRDGMHVHIGAAFLEKDEEACKRLVRSWYQNQALIMAMCSSHRKAWGSCPTIKAGEHNTVGQKDPRYTASAHWKGKYWGHRSALNLQSIPLRKTVEFRLHEGCIDPGKAIPWIQFCQKFVDYAAQERRVLPCAKSRTALLREIGVPEDAIAVLAKKQKSMPTLGKVYAR